MYRPHRKHTPDTEDKPAQESLRHGEPIEGASVTPVPSHAKNVLSTVWLFVGALIIAVLLNTFVIQSYQVDGQSMEKTLQDGDRLIVDKVPRTIARIDGHQYVPKRGDIIIFNQQGLPGFSGEKQLIKRVIGLPGDHVVVGGGHITIYNAQHPQGFNPDTTGDYRIDQLTGLPYDGVLKSDELFVCGDNRGNSEDSRSFGPIKTDQVVAKLVLRIFPINKARGF
ncbi:MAG TPA: signal peptidase I [Candidatus Saccharimonadales bacterium]|nr:signal peptidase I [Candidatus Saccharimonadales bacterium]